MAINFTNIPTTTRTPSIYTEVDNSRALKGLTANPHKALIIGQKTNSGAGADTDRLGTADVEILYEITNDSLADGFFGRGSQLARMCNIFKLNNPNTELWALALSCSDTNGFQASAEIYFSEIFSEQGQSASTANEKLFMYVNGKKAEVTITSGWSTSDVCNAMAVYISENDFPCTVSYASFANNSLLLMLSALNSGSAGNDLDVRFNYNDHESFPTCFGSDPPTVTTNFTGGADTYDLDNAWAIIDNEQFHYIIHAIVQDDNMDSIETALEDRFDPLEDLQGHGFVGFRGTQAQCTTAGNLRNSPHNTIIGVNNSPTSPEEWAAALGAVAAKELNKDPARPLHFLELKGVLPPPVADRFTRTERDILLTDGIATTRVNAAGNPIIDRCITTYQTNTAGSLDTSYLDVTTLATISEIRYQFKTRMTTRFIISRKKLADNTFPVQPGSNVVTPNTIKSSIIALFTELRDAGLIENLADFVDNLIVEKNATDKNRVDVLLPPDLIGQFRILAGKLQFLL